MGYNGSQSSQAYPLDAAAGAAEMTYLELIEKRAAEANAEIHRMALAAMVCISYKLARFNRSQGQLRRWARIKRG